MDARDARKPSQKAALDAPRSGLTRARAWLAPLLPLTGVVLVFLFVDLRQFDSPERVAEAVRGLRESPLALPYVMLAFGCGTLVFFPVTALIAGTGLAFDATHGIVYALLGVLVGATTTYWSGRALGSHALDYLGGRRLARIREELCTRALRASIIARLLPVGNFTLINMLAGSLRVPFRAFFLGNLLGALPGIVAVVLLATKLSAALRAPSVKGLAPLVIAIVLLSALGLWLLQIWRRRGRSPETRSERMTP